MLYILCNLEGKIISNIMTNYDKKVLDTLWQMIIKIKLYLWDYQLWQLLHFFSVHARGFLKMYFEDY